MYINTLKTYAHNKDLQKLRTELHLIHSSLHLDPFDLHNNGTIVQQLEAQLLIDLEQHSCPSLATVQDLEGSNIRYPPSVMQVMLSDDLLSETHLDPSFPVVASENISTRSNHLGYAILTTLFDLKIEYELLLMESESVFTCEGCEGNLLLANRKCQEHPPCLKAGWYPYNTCIPLNLVTLLLSTIPFVDRRLDCLGESTLTDDIRTPLFGISSLSYRISVCDQRQRRIPSLFTAAKLSAERKLKKKRPRYKRSRKPGFRPSAVDVTTQ